MKILTDVASDQQIASPQISVEVDRDAASQLGLSMDAIDAALYDAFGQAQVATIYSSTQQSYVVLEAQPKFQTGPAALSSVYVANSAGAEMPLSAVAHFVNEVQPLTVNHQGVFPAVTLSFNLAPGASLSQAVDAIDALTTQLRCAGDAAWRLRGHGAGLPGLAGVDADPGRGGDRRRLRRAGHAV